MSVLLSPRLDVTSCHWLATPPHQTHAADSAIYGDLHTCISANKWLGSATRLGSGLLHVALKYIGPTTASTFSSESEYNVRLSIPLDVFVYTC